MTAGLLEPEVHPVEELASNLVQDAALLARLVFARLDLELSRSEAAMLVRLEDGPQRITDLAELDGLAQPTVTLMVKRLERERLLDRAQAPDDRRVVLISLTDHGRRTLDDVRARFRERLRGCVADLPPTDVDALELALRVIGTLIERLQQEGAR